jgi:hypothetical protein
MIKELQCGICKKKGQAILMTQVARPFFMFNLLKGVKIR